MKKQNLISVILTVAVASAAIIGGSYAFNYMRETEEITPEHTVKQFFADWVGYEGNPLSDRYYAASSLASKEYVDKVDAIIASFEKGGFDPILCAQDFPEEIKFTNTAVKEDKAVVTIEKIFSGGSRMSEARLERQDGKWLITDIICEEGRNGGDDLNSGVSPAIQNQVGDYIRENINELSPKNAVLGGTFYITSIRFTGPHTCVVDYEDGHIALSAEAEFNVPAAGEVEVVSFELKDDNQFSFDKTGNLTKNDNNWNLVYEEPGKPGLTAILEFTDNSQCLDEYKDKSCSPVYWQVGDRVNVKGKHESGKIIVSQFSIIDENSREINSGVKAGDMPATNFEECVAAGNERMDPDCVGCEAYCETEDGERFVEESEKNGDSFCDNLCGDGTCQEIVCLSQGCPCAESTESCPQDCAE